MYLRAEANALNWFPARITPQAFRLWVTAQCLCYPRKGNTMRTIINATPIVNGKVIDATHSTNAIRGTDYARSELIALIGLTVMESVDKARRWGYHMADPNAFIRVEIKEHYDG